MTCKILKSAVLAHCLIVQSTFAATFGADTDFLKKHIDLIMLHDPEGKAIVAVAPIWQGRVMTSTAGGNDGASYGWINRDLIASGNLQPHINAFGGEDRFWLGPEGGQFSLFFAKGAPFDLKHWFTPAPIDTMPYKVISQTAESVKVNARFAIVNYSGTKFDVQVDRTVRLLDPNSAWKRLGLPPSNQVKLVAYESENTLTNAGNAAWKKETGLLSIWILGQFSPSPKTTIVVPFNPGPESELGVKVTSNYFGEVPPERLAIKDDTIFFSGDGQFRSKIGLNPHRSKGVLGSYDSENGVLSLVQFNQPEGATDYVNSLWKIQDHPYAGDAENSYNDGPPSPGAKPLGPFYEMESSSPAAALDPGQSITHIHTTMHLSGPESELDAVAKAILGVSLEDIEARR
jgi:hypothetical protein